MTSLNTLLKILNLKDEKRTGWQLRNIESPETVAGHSWNTAILTLIYGDKEEINTDKALKLAVIHDLGEVEIGDIAHRAVDAKTEMNSDKKTKLEKEAIEKISSQTDQEIRKLWEEYEERNTKESIFVKDMDQIDLCLQALKYEKNNRYNPEEENQNFQKYDNLDEFFENSRNNITTQTGKELFNQIEKEYRRELQDDN